MTQRLYYTDSYLCAFEAAVVERSDHGRRLYLDRTAFYPTSGGQPHDTGRLHDVEVTDVVDEGDRIAHVLAQPIAAGRVAGRVDWARRFDHMQQHTGQHLLSAVFADLLGHSTIAVHFGRDRSTIDLDTEKLTPDQIVQVEQRANQSVTENRPVSVTFEEADGAKGLRKESDRVGSLRIITIQDLDRSACGGTHVRATAEIGAILLGKLERVRKASRVEFVCGQRAVRRARADHDRLNQLAAEFTAAPDELPQLLAGQRNQLKEALTASRELEARLDEYRARELYAAAAPDATGIRRVVVRENRGSPNDLRGLAQAFAALPQGIFIGAVESPPAVLLAASADAGVDAGSMLKPLLASVGGKGGGSATLAQGVLPGKEQLDSVLASIAR